MLTKLFTTYWTLGLIVSLIPSALLTYSAYNIFKYNHKQRWYMVLIRTTMFLVGIFMLLATFWPWTLFAFVTEFNGLLTLIKEKHEK